MIPVKKKMNVSNERRSGVSRRIMTRKSVGRPEIIGMPTYSQCRKMRVRLNRTIVKEYCRKIVLGQLPEMVCAEETSIAVPIKEKKQQSLPKKRKMSKQQRNQAKKLKKQQIEAKPSLSHIETTNDGSLTKPSIPPASSLAAALFTTQPTSLATTATYSTISTTLPTTSMAFSAATEVDLPPEIKQEHGESDTLTAAAVSNNQSNNPKPLVDVSVLISGNLPAPLIDASGTRLYSFLQPAKFNHKNSFMPLDYCCPNLEGPMTSIDPMRAHVLQEAHVRELPAHIVLTTVLVSRNGEYMLPTNVRKKMAKLLNRKTENTAGAADERSAMAATFTADTAIKVDLTAETNDNYAAATTPTAAATSTGVNLSASRTLSANDSKLIAANINLNAIDAKFIAATEAKLKVAAKKQCATSGSANNAPATYLNTTKSIVPTAAVTSAATMAAIGGESAGTGASLTAAASVFAAPSVLTDPPAFTAPYAPSASEVASTFLTNQQDSTCSNVCCNALPPSTTLWPNQSTSFSDKASSKRDVAANAAKVAVTNSANVAANIVPKVTNVVANNAANAVPKIAPTNTPNTTANAADVLKNAEKEKSDFKAVEMRLLLYRFDTTLLQNCTRISALNMMERQRVVDTIMSDMKDLETRDIELATKIINAYCKRANMKYYGTKIKTITPTTATTTKSTKTTTPKAIKTTTPKPIKPPKPVKPTTTVAAVVASVAADIANNPTTYPLYTADYAVKRSSFGYSAVQQPPKVQKLPIVEQSSAVQQPFTAQQSFTAQHPSTIKQSTAVNHPAPVQQPPSPSPRTPQRMPVTASVAPTQRQMPIYNLDHNLIGYQLRAACNNSSTDNSDCELTETQVMKTPSSTMPTTMKPSPIHQYNLLKAKIASKTSAIVPFITPLKTASTKTQSIGPSTTTVKIPTITPNITVMKPLMTRSVTSSGTPSVTSSLMSSATSSMTSSTTSSKTSSMTSSPLLASALKSPAMRPQVRLKISSAAKPSINPVQGGGYTVAPIPSTDISSRLGRNITIKHIIQKAIAREMSNITPNISVDSRTSKSQPSSTESITTPTLLNSNPLKCPTILKTKSTTPLVTNKPITETIRSNRLSVSTLYADSHNQMNSQDNDFECKLPTYCITTKDNAKVANNLNSSSNHPPTR